MNYFSGGYEGFLTAKVKADLPGMPAGTELAGIELDCDQTGWGITPILGADVKLGKWNIGLKYEFMTSLNLENKTKKAEVRQMGNVMGACYETESATVTAALSSSFYEKC